MAERRRKERRRVLRVMRWLLWLVWASFFLLLALDRLPSGAIGAALSVIANFAGGASLLLAHRTSEGQPWWSRHLYWQRRR